MQDAVREDAGEAVQLLVGKTTQCVAHIKGLLPGQDVALLGRNNNDVVALRNGSADIVDSWTVCEDADQPRSRFLRAVCSAIVLSREGMHSRAVKTVHDGLRLKSGKLYEPVKYDSVVDPLGRRSIALFIVEAALATVSDNMRLLTFYNGLSDRMQSGLNMSLTRAVRGKFFAFAGEIALEHMLLVLPLADDNRMERTIHKSKGDEFANVVVALDESSLTTHIFPTRGRIPLNEESNIRYVALSRARDRLFLIVPALATEAEARIRAAYPALEIDRL